MALLSEDKLIWSPTVANSRMNRGRLASGINSYEQEIGFKPEVYLQKILQQKGEASWLDLCCGEGKALSQVSRFFQQQGLAEKVKLAGVDLVGDLPDDNNRDGNIEIHITPLLDFNSPGSFDLVTCIHGLHYIGDKFRAIEKAVALLSDAGYFIANLDLADIEIRNSKSKNFLNHLFKKNGLVYYTRKRLLHKEGRATIRLGCQFLGSNDHHGKNYTGQESVRSVYTI